MQLGRFQNSVGEMNLETAVTLTQNPANAEPARLAGFCDTHPIGELNRRKKTALAQASQEAVAVKP